MPPSLAKNTDIENLVALIVDDSINNEQACALLLDWLVTQLGGTFTLKRHAQRMLEGQIAAIDECPSSNVFDHLLCSGLGLIRFQFHLHSLS